MPGDPAAAVNAAMSRLLDDRPAALAELRRQFEDPKFPADSFPLAAVAQWAAYLGDPELSLPAFKDFLREQGLVDYWRASGNWGEFCSPSGKDDFVCR